LCVGLPEKNGQLDMMEDELVCQKQEEEERQKSSKKKMKILTLISTLRIV